MKKILLFTVAAATVMALTGCSQSSDLADTEVTTQTPISFDTYLAKTRAGDTGDITTNEALQTKGFGLFGYYTGTNKFSSGVTPNFMYNTKVYGSNWNYSPMRYWSNNADDMFSFFAYAPYIDVTPNSGNTTDNTSGITALSANSVSGAPYVQYKLSQNLTSSVDLLWGIKKSDNTTNAEMNTDLKKSSNAIGFTFKHALAKWGGADFLQAKIATDDAKFDPNITKITIENISINCPAQSLVTSGKFDLSTGIWSDISPDNNSHILLSSKDEDLNPDIAEKNYSGITNWNNIKGLSTTASNVYKNNTMSLYFIPYATSTKATVTVTYWTRTLDSNLQSGCTNVKQTITKDIQLPAFAANKKYTIILTIGLNTINFEAIPSEWTSDTSTSING